MPKKPPFSLYDHIEANGRNEIKAWTKQLQSPLRAKLNNRLDKLAQLGDALLPEMLSDSNVPGILKLRIKGNVQLRPMLCRGPINTHGPNATTGEYTLLQGAYERGGKLVPANADQIADSKKKDVIADDSNRRTKHERVS